MQTTKPNKKLLSTLMITLLAMSICTAVIPIARAAIGGITLDPLFGPVGTEDVEVAGTGATPWGLIKIYWNTPAMANLLTETYADNAGGFTCVITIPEDYAEEHWVIAKDTETGEAAGLEFTITAEIVLALDYGVIGDTITVSGTGFAADSIITLTSDPAFTITTVPSTVTTSTLGSFTCEFDIPTGITDDTYTITATDEDSNADTANLVVVKYITLTPDRGLIGSTVTVAGRGFTADGTIDIQWLIGAGITVVDDYDIDANGDFSTTFTVPLVVPVPTAPGDSYTVLAIDSLGGHAEATFLVVKDASITLTEDEGQPGADFTVEGTWFTAESTVTITFNGEEIGTAETDVNGIFTITDPTNLEVPSVSEGVYMVTATDEEGVSASALFTVLPAPTIEIRTRATEYLQGDTISIYGNCSEAPAIAVLMITDPNGVPFWGAGIDSGDWIEIDGWDVLPYLYGGQMGLPLGMWSLSSDVPLGDWNFTTYDKDPSDTTAKILDTNTFTVVAIPSIQMVLDRLDELEVSITDVVTTSEGEVLALITTAKGDILASLTDLNAKIVTINGAVATIVTDVGTVKVDVAAIKAKLISIEGDIATIETAVGTVIVDVAAINLVVTAIDEDVATIKTDVGIIKGQVLSVIGDVATIETDVGLVKADVSSVKTSVTGAKTAAEAAKAAVEGMTTLLYVAIGLSLVAALAAAFSVIQIGRKIAG